MWVDIVHSSCEIHIRGMAQNRTDEKSKLVQVTLLWLSPHQEYLINNSYLGLSIVIWVAHTNYRSPSGNNGDYEFTKLVCRFINPSFRRRIGYLTHWGRMTHICVSKLTNIGSDYGLSPGRHQAIFWTDAGILLIGPLGTNFNEMLIEIHAFSFTKIHLKMLSGKWQPFCIISSAGDMTALCNYQYGINRYVKTVIDVCNIFTSAMPLRVVCIYI